MNYSAHSISGVVIHPCMRKYRIGLFSGLASYFNIDVIESARPASGGFVEADREEAINNCKANFIARSRYKIPYMSNSNFSIFKALSPKYRFVMFSSFGSLPFLLLSLTAKILGKKVIVFDESWSYPQSKKYMLLKSLYVFLGKHCVDGYVLASTPALEFNNKLFGSNALKVLALNTHSDYSMELQKVTRSDSLLFLGRVVEIKGLDVLIKALPLTARNLVVYGDGDYLDTIKQLVIELGLEEQVSFRGECSRADVESILVAHEFFVLPSKEMRGRAQAVESWGFTVNEALECGCKVVISDSVGSARDLVSEGRNGFTFASGSVDDLAKKINSLDNITMTPTQVRMNLIEKCNNEKNALNIATMINQLLT